MKRYDSVALSKVEKTPQGGLKVQGVLTKTGIFTYKNPDGSERKEYRPPEEVFSTEHMDSFKGAPVTVGHPGKLTPDNWKDHAVGHVGDDVHQEDQLVVGTLYVQDAKAAAAVGKHLREISLGYDVDIDETPGQLASGERFDAVQRRLRGNHVAVGPVGWGRAGRDVAMRLDSNGDEIVDYTENDMTIPASDTGTTTKIKTDKIDIRVDGQSEIDRLTAENAMLRSKMEEQTAALADQSRVDSLVAERVALIDAAKEVVKDFKADGKSNRDIKSAVILAKNPKFKLDSKSSEDYVQAAYEMALGWETPAHPSLGVIRQDAVTATSGKDEVAEARRRNEESSRNAWKKVSTVGQA